MLKKRKKKKKKKADWSALAKCIYEHYAFEFTGLRKQKPPQKWKKGLLSKFQLCLSVGSVLPYCFTNMYAKRNKIALPTSIHQTLRRTLPLAATISTKAESLSLSLSLFFLLLCVMNQLSLHQDCRLHSPFHANFFARSTLLMIDTDTLSSFFDSWLKVKAHSCDGKMCTE